MSHRSAARIALVAAFVIALALVPSGLAGKGGGGGKPGGSTGGTGTISLVLLNSTDGLAHYGQKVTFAVSTTATSQPFVLLKCYRNGTLVYELANGIFPTSLGQVFTLGPTPAWSGGGADCTASLQNWSGRKPATLATLNFDVYA
jgi:hypothetical protein